MARLIVLILIAFAVFWCYNNLDFNKIINNVGASIQNEKTVKTVRVKRQFDYEQEQAAMENN